MLLALKIDVDTFRGTRDGVPRLAALLRKHRAGATFLFSLGPDHTGRAIKRVFRKDFVSKVRRTSVASHYGVRTLLYGTLLPGPDIGRRCAREMREVRASGFEAGIHCWDHVRWQDHVAGADANWTQEELLLSSRRFQEIFQEPAGTFGAAGWQTNRHAAFFQEGRFAYASDTRGHAPFQPTWDGVAIGCPQLPTTLPTLDELLGRDGVNEENVSGHILGLTADRRSHVFTAHAELEGGRLLGVLERLLEGWKAQGYYAVALRKLFESVEGTRLPRHDVVYGEVPGRSGTLALQAPEAPA